MIALCDRFLGREINLRTLVDGLEGLLNAGSFEDQSLRKRWYELWTPLEVRNAMGDADWSLGAKEETEALRSFLREAQE